MSFQSLTLTDVLKTLSPHDQLCIVCKTEEKWRAAGISFIRRLQRNGKHMHVGRCSMQRRRTPQRYLCYSKVKEILDAALEKTQGVLNAEGETSL